MVFRDAQYLPTRGMYASTWRGDPALAGAGIKSVSYDEKESRTVQVFWFLLLAAGLALFLGFTVGSNAGIGLLILLLFLPAVQLGVSLVTIIAAGLAPERLSGLKAGELFGFTLLGGCLGLLGTIFLLLLLVSMAG